MKRNNYLLILLLFITIQTGIYAQSGSAVEINTSGWIESTATGLPQGNASRTVEAWINTTSSGGGEIVAWGTNIDGQRNSLRVQSGVLRFTQDYNNTTLSSNQIVNDGAWHHVAMTHDGTNVKLYVDGVLKGSQATTMNTTGDNLRIGALFVGGGGSQHWSNLDASFDEVRVWERALSDTEIAASANKTFSNSTSLSSCLLVYYKMDEGTGTTIADETGNGFTASFSVTYGNYNWVTSGATVTTDAPTNCLNVVGESGSAVEINTSGWIESTATGLPQGNASRTVEAWINTTSSGGGEIVAWGTNIDGQRNSLRIQSGVLRFTQNYNNTTLSSNQIVNDGVWHHVAMTHDGTNVKLYVDGVLKGSQATTMNTTGDNLRIGALFVGGGGSQHWSNLDASFDEVRVWERALSDTEIAASANKTFSNSTSLSSCLLVYYKMDEGTGTTIADETGNGFTASFSVTYGNHNWVTSGATVTTDAPTNCLNVVGESGSAVEINTSGWIESTATGLPQGNASRTVEAWINTTSSGGGEIVAWGTNIDGQRNSLRIQSGVLRFTQDYNNTTLSSNQIVNDGVWHHVAMTHDGTNVKLYVDGVLKGSQATTMNTTGDNLRIGALFVGGGGSQHWSNLDASFDEVRVWERALSDTEIAASANKSLSNAADLSACLLVYYKMDEGTGTTIADETGNGFTASFSATYGNYNWVTSGATVTTDELPSCLNLTTAGGAVEINTSGWIESTATGLPQGCEARTVEAWINTTSSGGGEIVAWGTNIDGQRNSLRIQSGVLRFTQNYNNTTLSSNQIVNDGVWHHVAMTYDGVDVKLYVDGVLKGSQATTMNTTGDNLRIGALFVGGGGSQHWSNLDASFDEVRVWKRALSAAEIASAATKSLSNAADLSDCLLVYYKMDEGTGTTIADETGNGFTASFSATYGNYNWIASGATLTEDGTMACATPAPTVPSNYFATAGTTPDADGFTPFTDAGGNVLMSVKAPAGVTIPANAIKLKVGTTAATYYPQYSGGTRTGGTFIQRSGGGVLINRFWTIDESQITGTVNSNNPLELVFYFTQADFDALNLELTNNGQPALSGFTDLQAYVVKNASALPDFPTPADIGNYRKIYKISNATDVSSTGWKFGAVQGDLYSIKVKVFRIDNGGGLGYFF